MSHSQTEENYLKAIYQLSQSHPDGVTTKSISQRLNIKAPTVSDMLKRLSAKKLIRHARYKGVTLTQKGIKVALTVIRKHRLWETFLVEKFKFKWDEVHDIAEQLEHIQSPVLVNRLDEYLGFPPFDPHGDPIPTKEGLINSRYEKTLDQITEGSTVEIVSVRDHSSKFLQYLESLSIQIGTRVKVVRRIDYDHSVVIETDDQIEKSLSHRVCANLFVK